MYRLNHKLGKKFPESGKMFRASDQQHYVNKSCYV
jgi:hypothetical protein